MRAGDQLANPEALNAGRLDLSALEEMYGASEYSPGPFEALEIENAAPSMEPAEPGGVGNRGTPIRPPGGGVDSSIGQWLESINANIENNPLAILQSRRMTTKNGGLHPDIAADLILNEEDNPLFSSGDQMVRELAAAIQTREAGGSEILSGESA
jgi:hypothetical protein